MTEPTQEQIKSLEERLAREPQSPLFARLAAYYLSTGRAKDALRLCDNGLAHFPFYSTGHLIKGNVLVRLGMMAEAKHEYEVVCQFMPSSETAARLWSSIDLGSPSDSISPYAIEESAGIAEPEPVPVVEPEPVAREIAPSEPTPEPAVEEAVQEEALREEAVQEEVLHEEAVQEEVVHEEAVQEEVLHEEAVHEEVVHEEAAQEEVVQEEAAPPEPAHEQTIEEAAWEEAAPAELAPEQAIEEVVEEEAAPPEPTPEQAIEEGVWEEAAPAELAPDQAIEEVVEEKAAPPEPTPEQAIEEIVEEEAAPPESTSELAIEEEAAPPEEPVAAEEAILQEEVAEELPPQEPASEEPPSTEQAETATATEDAFGLPVEQPRAREEEPFGAAEKLGLPMTEEPPVSTMYGFGATAEPTPEAVEEMPFGETPAQAPEAVAEDSFGLAPEAPAEPAAPEITEPAAEAPAVAPAAEQPEWFDAFSQLQQAVEETPAAPASAPEEEENPFAMFGADQPTPAADAESYEDFTARIRIELFGTENTMSLEEYLGGAASSEADNTDQIGELAEKLKTSPRITPPVINFAEKSNRTSSDVDAVSESGFATPTLAEIYVTQGWYDDAIKAYKTMAGNKPEEREKYEQRIAEIEEMKRSSQ